MQKGPFFFLEQTEEGPCRGRPVRRRLPASRATVAPERWGKTERRPWATDSAPHLGRGQPVEVDRRRRADCGNGGSGGGAAELGKEMEVVGEVRVVVEGDAGPFIGGGRDEGGGRQVAGGWHRKLAVMAGEGGTARCRAVHAVASRIDGGVEAACALRRPGRQRRGLPRSGAEATASLTTRATRRRGCSGVVEVGMQ
jgi:hypothetical protein